jgi:AcrR family transcriptional regulator
MPRLWNDTIEEHRREVRDAILDTTAALVDELGLLSVTMSAIAERTGIGRATLYKYFPDVEAILRTWHQRQISAHLDRLADVRDGPGDGLTRLTAVLEAYALITHESHGHHNTELGAFLHRDDQVAHAEHQLLAMLRALIIEAAGEGGIRTDVPAGELAVYCVNALQAATALTTRSAVRRLVGLTLDGLRPI